VHQKLETPATNGREKDAVVMCLVEDAVCVVGLIYALFLEAVFQNRHVIRNAAILLVTLSLESVPIAYLDTRYLRVEHALKTNRAASFVNPRHSPTAIL